jgi:hypothetical protein
MTLSYEEQFKDVVVPFSPFVLNSTGIIQSQTSLKVDTYTLACVPYQISMTRAVLIGAFTKDEIVFFQRFKGALAGLTLTVQRATLKEPEKIFCRCQVSAVGQMKGRDRVGLIVCDFKPIPPALARMLGEHLIGLDRLRAQWRDYRDRSVQVNPESSRRLGYNNYAVMSFGQDLHKLALYSLAVNRLHILMPMKSPDIIADTEVTINLYFQKYRFGVKGRVEESHRLPTGVQRLAVVLEFSPELCDLMSDYFFASNLASKKALSGPG